MPITVVSMLPDAASAASGRASSVESGGEMLDFAGLLLGGLASTAALPAIGESAADSEPETSEPAADDAGRSDPASLLAALQMGPAAMAPLAVAIPPARAGAAASAPSGATVGTRGGARLGAVAPSAGQVLAPPGDQRGAAMGDAAESALAKAEGSPARFAVADVPAPAPESMPEGGAGTDSAGGAAADAAAAPATMPQHPAAHARAADAPRLAVATPVVDRDWSADFGRRIVWMAGSGRQAAELTLNPAELGPIEVSLTLDRNGAVASFAAADPAARDAIEAALPKLREMFASAGIALGHTQVSAESFRQQEWSAEGGRGSSPCPGDAAILAGPSTGPAAAGAMAALQGIGLVDIFA